MRPKAANSRGPGRHAAPWAWQLLAFPARPMYHWDRVTSNGSHPPTAPWLTSSYHPGGHLARPFHFITAMITASKGFIASAGTTPPWTSSGSAALRSARTGA